MQKNSVAKHHKSGSDAKRLKKYARSQVAIHATVEWVKARNQQIIIANYTKFTACNKKNLSFIR